MSWGSLAEIIRLRQAVFDAIEKHGRGSKEHLDAVRAYQEALG